MDMSELAQLMLKWEKVRCRADEMEQAIKDAVLQIGKTQTVGNVRASFSAGRKSYSGIEDVPCEKSPPSVSVKLLS